MPEIDGYEVYRIIRLNPALDGVPVLFITSLIDIPFQGLCQLAGWFGRNVQRLDQSAYALRYGHQSHEQHAPYGGEGTRR